MSSKRAVRRKAQSKSCSGKERHEDKASATAHLIHLWAMDREPMQAYHCKFCGFWHIGRKHKSSSQARKIANGEY